MEVDGSSDDDLEDLRQELRRRKLTFISVDSQLRLLQMCMLGEEARRDDPREDEQRELKTRTKAVKAEIEAEREHQSRLRRQLAEAKRELAAQRAAREREASQLDQMALGEDLGEADPSGAFLAEGVDMAAREAGAAGERAGEDARLAAALMTDDLADDSAVRREADAKLVAASYATIRKQLVDARAEAERLEARERKEMETLEHLLKKERELGLPEVRWHDNSSVVVSGGGIGEEGAAGTPSVELRTVKVAFDAKGRLIKAEPHPSLEMWQQSDIAVKEDDLPRLVSRVCERLRSIAAGGGA